MQIRRLSPSKVAFATALFVVFSFNSVPSTPSANTTPAPSTTELEEIGRLQELATFLGAAADAPHVVRQHDVTAALGARRSNFEAFPPGAGGPLVRRLPYGEEILAAAERYRLDGMLLAAMVEAESSFDPTVVSPRGAIGLLQVMPGTAAGHGVADPFDPQANLDLGARYFSGLLRRFDGDVELALAAYNAGPAAVERYGGVPPYRETNRFVARVLARCAAHHEELRQSGTGQVVVAAR